jgi:small subunit ribosomal protein S4
MGRHTGPVERLSRREGVELYLKGERALNGKSALVRRGPAPPGQHGNRRGTRPSIYATQLRQKQRLKRYYGVRERQLRRYVREASRRREGRMGEHLLTLLERRLDNVVYRLGFAATRAQARQFVTHGHVLVDGRKVDIPSYSVRPGQQVSIRAGSPVLPAVQAALELSGRMPGWIEADVDALAGRVLREPARNEIPTPVEEQLIVEYFARR